MSRPIPIALKAVAPRRYLGRIAKIDLSTSEILLQRTVLEIASIDNGDGQLAVSRYRAGA